MVHSRAAELNEKAVSNEQLAKMKAEFHGACRAFCEQARATNVAVLANGWRVVACRGGGAVVCVEGANLNGVTVAQGGRRGLPSKQEVLKAAAITPKQWRRFKGKVNIDALKLLEGLGAAPVSKDESMPAVVVNRGRQFVLSRHAVERWAERAAGLRVDLVRSFARARTVFTEANTEFLLDKEAMLFYAVADGNVVTLWVNEYGLGPALDRTLTLRQLNLIKGRQREYSAAKRCFDRGKDAEYRLEQELARARSANGERELAMRSKAKGFYASKHMVFKAHEALMREEEVLW